MPVNPRGPGLPQATPAARLRNCPRASLAGTVTRLFRPTAQTIPATMSPPVRRRLLTPPSVRHDLRARYHRKRHAHPQRDRRNPREVRRRRLRLRHPGQPGHRHLRHGEPPHPLRPGTPRSPGVPYTNDNPPRERGARARQETHDQACRQRWRALLLVIKAKLEAVTAGISTVETEFLATPE